MLFGPHGLFWLQYLEWSLGGEKRMAIPLYWQCWQVGRLREISSARVPFHRPDAQILFLAMPS